MTTLTLFALLLSPNALAGGKYAEFDKMLTEGDFASAGEKCGKTFDVSIDWDSFADAYTGNYEPSRAVTYCAANANALYWTCDDEAGKTALCAAIDSLHCVYDTSVAPENLGRRGPALSLVDKRLEARFHWDTTNFEDTAKEWVARTLKGPDGALSLWDHRHIEEALKYYANDGSFKRARERCGKDLPASYSWPGFIGAFGDTNRNHSSAVKWCEAVYEGIWNACDTESGKAYVTAKIDRVHCSYDAEATEEALGRTGARVAVEDGTLKAGYHWDSVNIGDRTRDWIAEQ